MSRIEHEAARLDGVIDDIIHGPGRPVPLDHDGLVATARLLHEALPRLHPRFSFEEYLAARLAAAGRQPPVSSGAATTAIAPVAVPPPVAEPAAADRRRRSLVAGGAIASGVSLAIPIAGAAWVAWRRSRSSGGIF